MTSPVQAETTVVSDGDIAFTGATDVGGGSYEQDVYKVAPTGGPQTNLTPSQTGDAWLPSYSPDGTQLSYSQNDPTGTTTVNKMNADGSGKSNLSGDTSPVLSQGGRWGSNNKIAFQRYDGAGNLAIWSMDGDGTNQSNLTNGTPSLPYRVVWAADGSKIYFNQQSTADIWSINSNGTSSVDTGHDGYIFDFSNNGQKVIYASSGGSDPIILTIANSDFSNPVQLFSCDLTTASAGNVCTFAAVFSPSDSKIAHYSYRVVDPNNPNTWEAGIFVTNLADMVTTFIAAVNQASFGNGEAIGLSWRPIITVVPDPSTPGPGDTGSGRGPTQAAVNPALDPVGELPKAGGGGMAGAYAGAVAAYGAYCTIKRKRWDIMRRG